MTENQAVVAGLDVGTECVKALVLRADGAILGRTVTPTRGYFQERVRETLDAALDEAQIGEGDLAGICATGFGADCFDGATLRASEAACHAAGAAHHHPQPLTVIDIGGRDPVVIQVDDHGRPTEIYTVRRCAIGLGTFLMYAARHLDVHPTRLQELAAAVDAPAPVGSYCSVFAGSEILERLREGESREAVALGCMHSVARRISEIGGFKEPMRITGGVVEYFPGVLKALVEITGIKAESLPEPIMIGALGAALKALEAARAGSRARG